MSHPVTPLPLLVNQSEIDRVASALTDALGLLAPRQRLDLADARTLVARAAGWSSYAAAIPGVTSEPITDGDHAQAYAFFRRCRQWGQRLIASLMSSAKADTAPPGWASLEQELAPALYSVWNDRRLAPRILARRSGAPCPHVEPLAMLAELAERIRRLRIGPAHWHLSAYVQDDSRDRPMPGEIYETDGAPSHRFAWYQTCRAWLDMAQAWGYALIAPGVDGRDKGLGFQHADPGARAHSHGFLLSVVIGTAQAHAWLPHDHVQFSWASSRDHALNLFTPAFAVPPEHLAVMHGMHQHTLAAFA